MSQEVTKITNKIQIHAIERLRNSAVFHPAEGSNIVEYELNGETITAHTSYYLYMNKGEIMQVRASEHGTALRNWVVNNPQKSLQNVSIVFSDNIPTSNIELIGKTDVFFIVEQY